LYIFNIFWQLIINDTHYPLRIFAFDSVGTGNVLTVYGQDIISHVSAAENDAGMSVSS